MNPPDAMLEHRIRQRAYEIYHARLENPALYDWLQAEHEILKEAKQFDRSQFESEAGPKKSGESRVVLNPSKCGFSAHAFSCARDCIVLRERNPGILSHFMGVDATGW